MNFFDDDPKLRHTIEFYLGPEQMELIGNELSEFGAIAAGELSDCKKLGKARTAQLIHQSGIMALHSEPGNAVEHIALCLMIARADACDHLRDISLESGLAKLLSVVDIEELRFEFMPALLDRRIESRARVGKTEFVFAFPPEAKFDLPGFISGDTPESAGTLNGEAAKISRSDANLIFTLARARAGDVILCLARSESQSVRESTHANLIGLRAWRLGTHRHALEFMLDFLRANEQVYAFVMAAGLLRAFGTTALHGAWSDATFAGAVYLAYIEDMVELGHARQPEAVFRRVMLECADAFLLNTLLPRFESDSGNSQLQVCIRRVQSFRDIPPGVESTHFARLSREMAEKNLWPLCREKFEKFLGELDEPRMEAHRESLREKLLQLVNRVEANPSEAAAPALAGGLFMALTLASEANWSLKNRDCAGKMESVARVIESLNQ